jgi:hypothetical protein
MISFLKCSPSYIQSFTILLQQLGKLQNKTHTERELKQLHQDLIHILARLELKLPLYWCSSTRHFLLHAVEQIKKFGSFWVHSMLGAERYHVLLKRLACCTHNKMKSLAKYLGIHHRASLNRFSIIPYCFSSRYTMFHSISPHEDTSVQLKGRTHWKTLTGARLNRLMELWASEQGSPEFSILKRGYDAAREKQRKRPKANVFVGESILDWKKPDTTESERIMLSTSKNILVPQCSCFVPLYLGCRKNLFWRL